jgi:hypothetical protein
MAEVGIPDRLANPMRLVLCLALLTLCLVLAPFARPDLLQDYLAACAWWTTTIVDGPAASLERCPGNLGRETIMQTAHPPAATLLALPLALLGWPQAYYSWIVVGSLAVGFGWIRYRIPVLACLAVTPVIFLGIHRGALEPLLFPLLAAALYLEERRPRVSAALIGLAAALKVYPVLLLAAFIWRKRYRELGVAIICGLAATALAELVLGAGVFLGWLRYSPGNVARWIANPDNVSLVRVALGVAPPLLIALLVYAVCLLALRRRLLAEQGMRALVPVALMATPLVWSHYLGILALASLGPVELLLLGGGGALLVLSATGLVPLDSAALVYAPLLSVATICWIRAWREGRPGS